MKDILADIYNRMVNFFQNENEEENAKDVAYNRLKLVLTQDRMRLDSVSANQLKEDLLNLLSKYMDVKEDTYDVSFSGEENELAFMFNIGITRTKTYEEIEQNERKIKKKSDCDSNIYNDENTNEILDENAYDKIENDENTTNEKDIDIKNKEDEKNIDNNSQVDNNINNEDNDEFDGILIATKDKDGNKIIKKSGSNNLVT